MFENIGSGDLEELLVEVESGHLPTPITVAGLLSKGLSELVPYVDALKPFDCQSLSLLCRAVLAERAHVAEPAELVWTGPEGRLASGRSTEVVFRNLLGSAAKTVWMAGYAVDHGDDLFAPLHRAMVERGVTANFLLNLEANVKHDADIDHKARFLINQFITENWPFEGPRPSFYYDPRTLDANVYASMHAKTLVIDEAHVLIGSANFTNRGQTRNIEAGALLHDQAFAKRLVTQFQSLIDSGYIRSYDGG